MLGIRIKKLIYYQIGILWVTEDKLYIMSSYQIYVRLTLQYSVDGETDCTLRLLSRATTNMFSIRKRCHQDEGGQRYTPSDLLGAIT